MPDIDAIRNRAYHAANNRHRWGNEVGVTDVDVLDGLRRAKQLAVDDVPALLAEINRLTAERDWLLNHVDDDTHARYRRIQNAQKARAV